MRRIALILLLALAACLVQGTAGEAAAWARGGKRQTAAERKAYRKFEQAGRLFDARKYQRALKLFRQVAGTLESPNALFMAARCLVELRRLPEAFDALDDTVKLATKRAKDDPSYLETRDAAAAEREKVAAKVGRIMLAVDDPPDELVITIEASEVPADRWGREIGIAAGSVEIEARAPDHEPMVREIDVEPGQMQTVIIALEPEGQPDGGEPDTGGGQGSGSGDGLRTGGFVVLGLGVVGMGAFAITGVMANKRFSRIEQECGEPPCTEASYRDLIEEGRTLDTVANVSLAIGAAGLAVGTAMVLLGWPSEEDGDGAQTQPDDPELDASLMVGPAGAVVGLTVSF